MGRDDRDGDSFTRSFAGDDTSGATRMARAVAPDISAQWFHDSMRRRRYRLTAVMTDRVESRRASKRFHIFASVPPFF
jgi:hypothetical protein